MDTMQCEAATTAASVLRDHAKRKQYDILSVEVTNEPGRAIAVAEAKVEVKQVH